MNKVSIIGAGQVGASAAFEILRKGFSDVVLVDVIKDLPIGKALDMMEASPVGGFKTKIQGTSDYADIEGSDLVVITAGSPRHPGMSRRDLLGKNGAIVKDVVERVQEIAPDAVALVVTNPLDVMTRLTQYVGKFPRNRVLGMGGLVDTVRFRYFLAETAGFSPAQVEGLVLGEHGDQMVPLPRLASINGDPVTNHVSHAQIVEVIERTRQAGAEINSYLKTGSASWTPGLCVASMVEAIINDTKAVVAASYPLQGEYGIEGVCLGVPVRLGRQGVEEVVQLELVDDELKALQSAAESVRTAWYELKENWGLS